MYYLVIRQLAFTLKNLDALLGKAEEHASERKFDVNNFCGERMAPDMFPFSSQIRIACDHAKNAAALLAGRQPPRHEDTEQTFADLRGRIAKCVAYLDTFTAKDFEALTPEAIVKIPNPPGKALRADEYLLGRQIPNFFFHVTTAYNLLRRGGVPVGKRDFIGPLNLIDA